MAATTTTAALCRDGVWADRAFLAEYFPAGIRRTSVSVPYHIGNGWSGGLVPLVTTAAFQSTGSLGYALIYPIAVPAVCFVFARQVITGAEQKSRSKRLRSA